MPTSFLKMNATDQSLLQSFAQHRCEDSFAALVSRHINLVYSAALRQVSDPTLAEEVVQSVFTDLARSAPTFGPQTAIQAWLHQVTRRTAIDVVRRESRRAAREKAAMQFARDHQPAEPWDSLAPVLDEAMQLLPDADRTVLLIRYFEDRSLQEVGAALGISDDAAQKRVRRALDRLRTLLEHRGVSTGAGGLGTVLAAHAITPAPAGLASAIAAIAVSNALISTSAPLAGGLLTMTSSTQAVVAITIAAALLTVVPPSWHAHRLNRENVRLRSELAALEDSGLREKEDASARLAAKEAELEQLREDRQELLRLRATAAERLHREKPTVPETLASPQAAAGYLSLPSRSPAEAMERFMQAARAGDEAATVRFSAWRRDDQVPDQVLEVVRNPNLRNATNSFARMLSARVLQSRTVGPDHERARLEFVLEDGSPVIREMEFMCEDGEWKPAFLVERSPSGSFSVSLIQGLTPEFGPAE
ncbi:MAG: sigma-70 family RNA polymerase sigma factor [Verrucomicrobiae bacterium]|nr:sigma-70 family RNA polymerase sigma factor [Verrucomicrobiae bacterium]